MNFDRLETEQRNPRTHCLDMLPTSEIVAAIHREDETVTGAIGNALPRIAAAADLVTEGLRAGGRLFYIGAGTSGRLGVLDAAECPPTFNTPPEMVQALIAGGKDAIFKAVEGVEDDPDLAAADLAAKCLSSSDVVVGLTASGRTPYVVGGLRYAASVGCKTIAVVCVSDTELAGIATLTVAVPVGPEVIAGSTRMKAGTAQKMFLNMLSTTVMIKLGKTYGNLMVDVRASNAKLAARVRRIVREATGAGEHEADAALSVADGSAKTAIVMLLGGITVMEAEIRLEQAGGSVRRALSVAEAEKQKRPDLSAEGRR